MATLGLYEVGQEIGHSATGAVYRAQDPQGRPLAIKAIPYGRLDEPARQEFLSRFHEMANASLTLSHPNIVPVYDYGQQQGVAFLAMELVDGMDMRRAAVEFRPIPLIAWVRVLEQIAAALDHCHQQGLVHGDLKPANVLIQADGVVRLTDFLMGRIQESRGFSQPGKVLESLSYMAPERLKTLAADPRTDAYSLAVLAFEWLSGRNPYVALSANELMTKIVFEPPPSFLVAAPQMPPALEEVFAQAMSRVPDYRFPACRHLVHALSQALGPLLWHAPETNFSWQRRFHVEQAAEEHEWHEVSLSRNRQQLETFLRRHPKGKYAADARRRLAEMDSEAAAWREVQESAKPQHLKDFLDRYPTGPFTLPASSILAGLEAEAEEWRKIAQTNDPQLLADFLTRYPKGQFVEAAQKRLSALWEEGKQWKAVQASPTPGALREFLAHYPDSRFRQEAEELLNPRPAVAVAPPPVPQTAPPSNPPPTPPAPIDLPPPQPEPLELSPLPPPESLPPTMTMPTAGLVRPAEVPTPPPPAPEAPPPSPKAKRKPWLPWMSILGVVLVATGATVVLRKSPGPAQAFAPPQPAPFKVAEAPPDPDQERKDADREEKAWLRLQALAGAGSTNLKPYLDFLRTFPTGIHAPLAHKAVEELSERALWESTRNSLEIKDWEIFLGAYPDSPNAAGARDRLGRLRAEQQAWDRIVNAANPEPFTDFLKAFPDGRYAALARRRSAR